MKSRCLKITILIFLITFNFFLPKNNSYASDLLDTYEVNLPSYENPVTIKKGKLFNVILENNVSSGNNKKPNNVSFKIPLNENDSLMAEGIISMLYSGARLSRYSALTLSSTKLTLEDGKKINFTASSPVFSSRHPSHADSSTARLARAVTTLAVGSSPLTLGAGIGAAFLINGLLSAHKNGPQDFFWGGFSGSGLSFIETLLRKQPDVYLQGGKTIPLMLTSDIKINNGIKKEKNIEEFSSEKTIEKIETLLKWGDLSGALELAAKSGQKEKYNELIKKIQD